ncbi:DMT family transporter [Vreelandella populi]|uniref:DMT family transporter n=1 Tax=Vreelandella populi TaxID=2498858 RepID=UPI000F8DE4AF|nr:DMT family transporter [Halomonas populi]RUR53076.1 DMT family transporter [Halomonas populi]
MRHSQSAIPTATYQKSAAYKRKPVGLSASGLMLLFCLILGFQQVAIKGVAEEISPLTQIALRSLFASLLVIAWALWKGVRWRDVCTHWRPGLLVGLGFTCEFVFLAWGLHYTLASHMSVFLYTAPIFAALGLHVGVPGEQLAHRQWWGIGFAFIGMVIAIAPGQEGNIETDILFGDMLGILAGLSWAATTVVIRRSSLSEQPAELTLSYQLSVTALLLMPAALVSGQLMSAQFSSMAILSLGFQTIIVSFGALLLWFSLLRRYRASQLGVFSFLAPLFGLLFGTLLLNEPLSLNFLIGGVAIMLGIVVVVR